MCGELRMLLLCNIHTALSCLPRSSQDRKTTLLSSIEEQAHEMNVQRAIGDGCSSYCTALLPTYLARSLSDARCLSADFSQ